jgi:hypothetical protein
MITLLPQLTYLGKLNIIEVYEAFDEPCLFACQNASGQIFLAVLIDENEDGQKWLYVALSQKRFEQIKSGTIDLHDSFKMAEDGMVYGVRMPILEDGISLVDIIPCDALSGDILPLPGEFVELIDQPELMASNS